MPAHAGTMIRLDPSRLSPAAASAMLTAAMACLALNHVIGRGVHETAPPVGLSFWRWISAALLVLLLIGSGLGAKLPIYRRHWALFLGLGVLMVGSTTLFIWTLQFTQAMNVSLVNALQPTMTVLLTFLFLSHRLTPLQILGVVIGFVGVIAMVSQGSWQVLAGLDFNRGDLFALVAVLGLSAYAVCLRRLPAGLTPLDALFGIIVAGCLALLPVYLLETSLVRPFPVTTANLGAVLAMGTIGSVAGNLMWNMGNLALGPNRASIFINLIPVFGVLMAIVFLGEQLRAYHVAGFALICAGLWCVLARRVLAEKPA
jgi:drug/metabolite transporter (DMT)-like permease